MRKRLSRKKNRKNWGKGRKTNSKNRMRLSRIGNRL